LLELLHPARHFEDAALTCDRRGSRAGQYTQFHPTKAAVTTIPALEPLIYREAPISRADWGTALLEVCENMAAKMSTGTASPRRASTTATGHETPRA
jgi:hypothetical protein